jgi:hypothetical protein
MRSVVAIGAAGRSVLTMGLLVSLGLNSFASAIPEELGGEVAYLLVCDLPSLCVR